MNDILISREAKQKWMLEKAIRDFKAYDKERQEYLRGIERQKSELEESNTRLRIEIQRLNFKIEALIDAYDNARPMKDNSGSRAYVKELLDKIAEKPTSTIAIEGIDSVLAREVVALRKGHSTLQAKVRDLKEENRKLKSKITERL